MRRTAQYAAVGSVGLTILAGCVAPPTVDGAGDDGGDYVARNQPGLLYVLQPEEVSTDELVDAAFGWLVLEPSRSGDAAGELTAAEVEALRTTGPCDGKTVLAYLSIGEAEGYRDYWDPAWTEEGGEPAAGAAPSWLGPANPDFGGNYKVRYWDSQWQSTILGSPDGITATPLDRIIDAGYDGVYLDIIDAYEFWSSAEGGNELTRAEAREEMIRWVERIAEYARTDRGAADFLVFPQNGSDIIRNDADELDTLSESYFDAIDGIGIEDLFYDETEAQLPEDTEYRLEQLAEYRARGKTVLVTDYVLSETCDPDDDGDRVADFYERTLEAGFVPYAAVDDRDLDEIVVLSGTVWPVSQPPVDCVESAQTR